MAYITCEDLALGYEGKAVTEHIYFYGKQRGLPLHYR